MNNQDILYNIALTPSETEDVMNTLSDRASTLAQLQKKIYNQAIQQKNAFEKFMAESATNEQPEVLDAKTGKKAVKDDESNGK